MMMMKKMMTMIKIIRKIILNSSEIDNDDQIVMTIKLLLIYDNDDYDVDDNNGNDHKIKIMTLKLSTIDNNYNDDVGFVNDL